jgi:hypothetical protein
MAVELYQGVTPGSLRASCPTPTASWSECFWWITTSPAG